MDKSTLSNYGWVVIVTLVLAVMLALATPFGSYVGKGASNVIKTFVNTSNDAIDEDNIDTQSDNWDAYLNNDNSNHIIVAEDSVYTNVLGQVYYTGDKMPQLTVGDTYECGSYTYSYIGNSDKWRVAVKDKTQTTYEPFLQSINGEPIYSALNLFDGCSNLEYLPEGFVLPEGMRTMQNFFRNCTSLKTIPSTLKIPSTVTIGANMFWGCTSLETIPETFVIPSTIATVNYIFKDCINLTGDIYYENNPTASISSTGILIGTSKPITLHIPASQITTSMALPENVTKVIY